MDIPADQEARIKQFLDFLDEQKKEEKEEDE
jgi:hypothetical protein